jgi:putative lumazine-binding protein
MRSRAIAVVLTLSCASPVVGQSPTRAAEDVRRAVLDYVEGFYEGDTAKLTRSISPVVHKYGYWIPRDSTKYVGEPMPWPEFLAYANRVRQNRRFAPATAPKEVTVFEVLDQTASAKLVAYWGVDYLLLAKQDGKWMITNVLWQTPPRK